MEFYFQFAAGALWIYAFEEENILHNLVRDSIIVRLIFWSKLQFHLSCAKFLFWKPLNSYPSKNAIILSVTSNCFGVLFAETAQNKCNAKNNTWII